MQKGSGENKTIVEVDKTQVSQFKQGGWKRVGEVDPLADAQLKVTKAEALVEINQESLDEATAKGGSNLAEQQLNVKKKTEEVAAQKTANKGLKGDEKTAGKEALSGLRDELAAMEEALEDTEKEVSAFEETLKPLKVELRTSEKALEQAQSELEDL